MRIWDIIALLSGSIQAELFAFLLQWVVVAFASSSPWSAWGKWSKHQQLQSAGIAEPCKAFYIHQKAISVGIFFFFFKIQCKGWMLVTTVLILYSVCIQNILTNFLRTSNPWKTHQAWPLSTAFSSCLPWPGPLKNAWFCCADGYQISSRLWKLVWGRYWNLARFFCRFLTLQELIQDLGGW